MVTADIERATGGLADAFEDHNINGILLGGGLATIGYAFAMTAGAAVVELMPGDQLGSVDRTDVALMGIAVAAIAYGGSLYLPDYLAGPLALGAVMAIGSAAWLVIFGVPDDVSLGGDGATPNGVNPASAVASTSLSGLLPDANSVTNMLPSANAGCTSCNQPPAQTTETGEARTVSHAPARQEGQFR